LGRRFVERDGRGCLGHVYSGQAAKGIKLFLAMLATYCVTLSGVYFGPVLGFTGFTLTPAIWVYSLVDAIKTARTAHVYELKDYNRWYVYVGILLLPSVLSSGARTLFVRAYRIPAASMSPTLEIGDHIVVDRLAYGIHIPFTDRYATRFAVPQRGDLVVFIFPEDRTKEFIKRVVAVAGDTVEFRAKKLFINGEQVEDPHAHFYRPRSTGGSSRGRRRLRTENGAGT
jgi:signal peptidase I